MCIYLYSYRFLYIYIYIRIYIYIYIYIYNISALDPMEGPESRIMDWVVGRLAPFNSSQCRAPFNSSQCRAMHALFCSRVEYTAPLNSHCVLV